TPKHISACRLGWERSLSAAFRTSRRTRSPTSRQPSASSFAPKDGLLALSEVCTHRNWNVQYQPEHYRFYCPIHGNKFTRTGAHIAPDEGTPPLRSYPIEFDGDQIIVNTNINIPRTPADAKIMVPIPAGVA
ncbi:MAG TPA: Rieske 2Fe-2S domain-containing protein, partial [Chloroflexota bacterium]